MVILQTVENYYSIQAFAWNIDVLLGERKVHSIPLSTCEFAGTGVKFKGYSLPGEDLLFLVLSYGCMMPHETGYLIEELLSYKKTKEKYLAKIKKDPDFDSIRKKEKFQELGPESIHAIM